jgi:hypothetical protein
MTRANYANSAMLVAEQRRLFVDGQVLLYGEQITLVIISSHYPEGYRSLYLEIWMWLESLETRFVSRHMPCVCSPEEQGL